MKKYLVECIGSFFFVLCIGLAVRSAGDLTPFVIGTSLMVLVYAWWYISGGHYNPAVTLWLAVSNKFSWSQVLPYWISQILGAVIAGLCVPGLLGTHLPLLAVDPSMTRLVVSEFLFTFLLVYVVHHVAVSNSGNSFYGLAIGFAVMVGAYAVGPISGAAFNPAVVIGSTFDGLFARKSVPRYVVTQLAAAAFAGLVYNAVTEPD